MVVAPKKLHGVASHKLCLLKGQPALAEHREGGYGHCRTRLLVRAHGARAAAAQVRIGINARVAVGPLDGHGIVARGNLNLRWNQRHRFEDCSRKSKVQSQKSKVESRRSKVEGQIRQPRSVTQNSELMTP